MRLTVATILFAGAVAASSHDAHHGKRAHKNRALTSQSDLDSIPHRIRFDGNHDLEDVPDGLVWDEEEADKAYNAEHGHKWFAADRESASHHDDDDPTAPWAFDPHHVYSNDTFELDQREILERRDLQRRGLPFKSKQCLAWTRDLPGAMHLLKDTLGMVYTWGPYALQEAADNHVPWAPMLRTPGEADTFKKKINKGGIGPGIIMSLNEPNIGSQASCSPGKAAWIHTTYIQPLKNKYGYRIWSPAPANGPSAFAWFDEFKKHTDVWNNLEGLNIHNYGKDAVAVTQYMDKMYQRYKKPIMLTEYACFKFGANRGGGTEAQAKAFVDTIGKFCNAKSWCKMHCLYGSFAYNSHVGFPSSLRVFNSKTALSSLGQHFAALS